jgi:hypothetical protein
MRILAGQVCMTVLLSAASTASIAHHGPSRYDVERTISLQGVVTDIQWTNPHIFLMIQSQDQNGDSVDWLIESASPNFLSRIGFNRETLIIGEEVEVLISPTIGEAPVVGWGRVIVKSDGARYDLQSQSTFFRDGADAVQAIQQGE